MGICGSHVASVCCKARLSAIAYLILLGIRERYRVTAQHNEASQQNGNGSDPHDAKRAQLNETHRSDISTVAHQPGIRLLEEIPIQDRALILQAASWHHYSKNITETDQGGTANQLFLLIKGSARFFFLTPQGQKVYLIWLKPGDIFGGAALLINPSAYLVNTEVAKGSRAFVWPRDVVRDLAARYPRLLENALLVASDYLTWYLATHLSLVSHSAGERLARVLTTIADGIGTKEHDGIHLHITNEQLANTANVSIFTASRMLSGWQEKKLVSKRRNQIILHSPEEILLAGNLIT